MPQVVRAQLDYYAVLEIAPSADPTEVNAAFRRLAWRYHPDRNPAPGATLQFQDINQAHQVLSDPARRAEYDARWHPRSGGRSHSPASASRPRYRRRWQRDRHLRQALLSVFALLFFTSAWAVIFTAMTAAHSAGASFVYEGALPSLASGSSTCSFSMEMFPVSYLDERGKPQTDWEADVHTCYGTSARISALPQPRHTRDSRFANGFDAR
jgi:curved DNA-binding protein CbpA